MRQFVRSLFWMARNAGRYGLAGEARQLFELARANAAAPGWDYRLFGVASSLLGFRHASRLAEALRSRARPGRVP